MRTINKTERRGSGRRPKITEKTKDDVILMYQKGFQIQVIQEKHGISASSIYRIIRERTVMNDE